MSYTTRKCDCCGKEYKADTRNLNRGWGLCCSKSCAAKKREMAKPGYDPETVRKNNIRRANWNNPDFILDNIKNRINLKRWGELAPNVGGSGLISGMTSEGYRIMDGVAYDEFDEPVYDVGIGEYDEGDSEYWNSKD
jgi:hypothetical protein